MMKKNIIAALTLSLLLGACGDSDSSSPEEAVAPVAPAPTEPTETPATGTGVFENVWGPDVKFELDTTVYAYLDRNLERSDMVDQFQRRVPANGIAIDPVKLRAAKAASYAAKDGRYIESEMFNDNQITFADVFMYLSDTRDDFHVDYQWDDELKAYRWEVSYDRNGDGDFDDEGDDNANPDWYATYMIDFGEFRRELYYSVEGEALYIRLENMLVQPNSGLNFRKYSKMMTKRRLKVQQTQAEIKAASAPSYYSDDTDVIVVPVVDIQPIATLGVAGGPLSRFNNVEARSHNLRPDIFKKDQAITMADVLLSMREQGLIDVGFSYWGKLEAGVDVQHFLVNEINGSRGSGVHGYVISTGVSWSMHDFSSKFIVSQQLGSDEASPLGTDITKASYCDHTGTSNPADPNDTSTNYPDGKIDAVGNAATFEECDPETTDISDWYADGESHIFSDVWLMNYPGDYMWVGNFNMYDFYPTGESQRWVGDEKWPIYDINDAIEPLTEEHFGWGVADCGNCHSLDGIHVDGDISTALGVNPTPVDVLDVGVQSYPVDDPTELQVAPYQCAECHGSNGAPKGHGETGRCFWCHAEDYQPTGHGTINDYVNRMVDGGNSSDLTFRTYEVVDVDSMDADGIADLEVQLENDFATDVNLGIYPPTEGISWEGYWGTYPDDMKVRTNNDWTTDPVYPDPYACVTCHVND
ncbi:hypothetical protein [Ferrimonas lipolytica]|uniref:Uncharacterized protein n=1 Tax=Ferrimonas lipolytica TaxID=2724191 RepID=A0A6H1UAK4_9GAMM|nr:hypothetical protein [Ferrimonas lipolytica]QIZ75669.1 hypothetical protein HER31_01375 [Ferrimonas lipolytica]